MASTGDGLARVAHWLHRHLFPLLLAAYAAAALLPGPGLWLRGAAVAEGEALGGRVRLTPSVLLLAVLLFTAGVGVAPDQLRRLPRAGGLLAAGLLANLLVPLAFLFAASGTLRLWHNPDEAQQVLVGLALVAAMPVAGSSAAWAQQAGGDLALSLGLVLLSTLLSPLTTPAALRAAGAAADGGYAAALRGLAGADTGLFLAAGVLLPSILGILTRLLLGEALAAAARAPLKLLSTAALLTLCYANAASALPGAVADPDYDFLAVVLVYAAGLCAAAFVGGWALARLLRADRGQQAALMYGLGMSNNGTGLVLGGSALAAHPDALLPVIIYNLTQHVVAAAVHRLRAAPGRRPV
jgi:BASS family bile acid:Na+ symporter